MAENILEICIGTPCHLMGAADLLEAAEEFEPDLKKRIEIKTSHCIDNCCEKAPVIKFNGEIYQDLNPEKLYKIIRENIR